MYKKKIRIQQENSYKITFPATTKKIHNHTTVLYTKYVRNTKNYFPPEPKKLTSLGYRQFYEFLQVDWAKFLTYSLIM